MRVAVALAVWTLALGGCSGGGGGDGPVPRPASAEELFHGDYALHLIEGDHVFEPWGWTAWGDLTADGAGTYAHTIATCDPWGVADLAPSPEHPYEIGSDRSVTWRRGSDFEWRGGVSADGAVLGMGTWGSSSDPVAGILLRRGDGMGPGALTGSYHYGAFGYQLPAVRSESRWGSATLDGASAGSVRWAANTEGSVAAVWVLEPLTYAVETDGRVTLDVTLGDSFTGGVLPGGELAVLSGGTTEPASPYLWVLVAASTDATVAQLDGTYFVVGIELDHSTQDPATRVYTGTASADGAGGLAPDLRMREEHTSSGISPLWSGYTVAADGRLEVTTPAGERWVGGVAPSGRFAVFAGDTAVGNEPVLFFLFR